MATLRTLSRQIPRSCPLLSSSLATPRTPFQLTLPHREFSQSSPCKLTPSELLNRFFPPKPKRKPLWPVVGAVVMISLVGPSVSATERLYDRYKEGQLANAQRNADKDGYNCGGDKVQEITREEQKELTELLMKSIFEFTAKDRTRLHELSAKKPRSLLGSGIGWLKTAVSGNIKDIGTGNTATPSRSASKERKAGVDKGEEGGLTKEERKMQYRLMAKPVDDWTQEESKMWWRLDEKEKPKRDREHREWCINQIKELDR